MLMPNVSFSSCSSSSRLGVMDTPLELVTRDILTKIKDVFQGMCCQYSPLHSPNTIKHTFIEPSIESLKYFEECADRACETAECLQKTNLEALSTSESKLKRIEEDSRLAIKELTSQLETNRQERCTIENECSQLEAKIKNLGDKVKQLEDAKQREKEQASQSSFSAFSSGMRSISKVVTGKKSQQSTPEVTAHISNTVLAGGSCVVHLGTLAGYQKEQKKSLDELGKKQIQRENLDHSITEMKKKQQSLKEEIEVATKAMADQRISIEQMQKRIENKLGAINQAKRALGGLTVQWTSLQNEFENCSEDIEEGVIAQKVSTKVQELLEEMRRQSEIFIEVLSPK